jgi:hypothetical protein
MLQTASKGMQPDMRLAGSSITCMTPLYVVMEVRVVCLHQCPLHAALLAHLQAAHGFSTYAGEASNMYLSLGWPSSFACLQYDM